MLRFILSRLGLTKENNETLVQTTYNGSVDLVLTLGDQEAHRQFLMSLASTNGQVPLLGHHKITVAIPNTKYSFSTYDYNLLGRIAYYMENQK
jgi:hypothetical protein